MSRQHGADVLDADTEEAIAGHVVAWLRDMDWDVHQEVMVHTYGARADIVGVRGAVLWVIEVKRSPGLTLLDQGFHWLHYAHYVSVAAPRPPRSETFHQFCLDHGIGFLRVSGDHDQRVWHQPPPRLHRKVWADGLRNALCDETRTWAKAGNARSDYFSPFRRTVKRVHELLQAHPTGLTMRQIVDGIDHHYASDATARGVLRQWILAGKIKGLVGDGGRPEKWTLAAPPPGEP